MNEPELGEHLEFEWTAFHALSGDRQLGAMGGCGPIPWMALDRFAERHGLDDDGFQRFCVLITRMDGAYRKAIAEKNEVQSKQK